MDTKPLIVGIGASAGGIPAMEGFFRHLEASDQLAFVVITHLNPQHESLLHQVIARQTALAVKVAEDDMAVEGGNVYVMPENATLSIEKGRLQLHELDPVHRERKPVDVFFSALAEDQGENAVGIVMSGGDSDGTLGVKAIKGRGGVTFAQEHDGSGPRNPEMPESAISSGLIDFAIPGEQMGEELHKLLRGRAVLDRFFGSVESDDNRLQRAQGEISKLLSTHSGHDFSGYKSRTFLRRVGRRMKVVQIQTIDSYIELLRNDPAEVMALFRDLLINVTEFFRDPEAFQALAEQVIPRLLEGRGADETVRIWVPGCATGEEVFSLGILLREAMDARPSVPRVQIFATDIDEPALAVARIGRYPIQLLKGLSEERLQRFFVRDGSGWLVSKKVRDLCVFSPHSIISDPPFSRMDLVSCRNLLIYLGRELQDKVIPVFHYALKPGGYLFLGTSESISQHVDLFCPVDKKHRIFQSRDRGGEHRRLPFALEQGLHDTPSRERVGAASANPLRQRVESQILERHAPAHVVVRNDGDVVYYSARTGSYLEAPRGAPNSRLLDLARREFRLDLRALLREAMESGRPSALVNVMLEGDEAEGQMVALRAEPLDGGRDGEPLFLVTFTPLGPASAHQTEDASVEAARNDGEMRELRERLQSTVEEYETALEELKSSNEELVSVNEEAQSTNEELEASKEEMQSLNEELNTINHELSGKVEELDRSNTDLKNLYEATSIATVFLDGQLVIRNFTPAASSFFNLRPSDIGRPLTELASALVYPDLQNHIREVFATGKMVEHHLTPNGDDRYFLVRLIPYRDQSDDVGGVVVTLVDITGLGRAEAHQKVLIAELNHRVKNMLAIVISIVNATLRHAPSPEAFTETLVGRLHGMARAYGLLSNENWSEVSIGDLVTLEINSHGSRRIRTEGSDIRLAPSQALAVGMVLHELATNAAKYGALSNETGGIEITWALEEDRVRLDWREKGGPEVVPPEREGFGFVLMRGQVEHQLGGELAANFDPDGFKARLQFPHG